ncbi:hypothetical protein CTRI78_v011308 [Colletotrichum trifolii]|uniref:Uncharacterized protein n=1 Tax=Colletotrichum trifolii TaxID=5466 RepID=A0A4R8QCS5_COLTR|nr:hypothetical protein CTRI78_v011308 [Colletotrichum trifolii]
MRLLTWITILTQPFTHVAALYSADGVMAFKKTWQTFVASWAVAFVFLMMLTSAIGYKIRQSVRKLRTSSAQTDGQSRNNDTSTRDACGQVMRLAPAMSRHHGLSTGEPLVLPVQRRRTDGYHSKFGLGQQVS